MQGLFNLLRRSKLVLGIIVILIIGYIGYFFFHFSITTDNAFVLANIQPIAAEVSGKVEKVYVSNNEYVKKGTLLFTLDAKACQIKLEQAKLDADALKGQLSLAKSSLADFKQKDLLQQEGGSRAQLQSIVSQKQIQLQKAQLSIEIAQAKLIATKVYAIEDGVVSNLFLTPGTLIQAYQPLFAFIDTNQWWVQANFKETDLAKVKKGDKAKIRLRMYFGDKIYHGTVESTNWAVGRRVTDASDLLQKVSQENQWLLLAQRFPVLIKINKPDPNFPLHVGASAYVTIE